VNSHASGRSSLVSLPPPAQLLDECLVDMQFGSHDPNSNITHFNSQPSLPLADSIDLEQVLDLKGSVSASSNDCLPATEPSVSPQAASLWPLRFLLSLRKSNTQPNNTRATLPIVLNRYRTIGSCLCLVVLLAYLNGVGAFAAKFRHFSVFSSLKLGLWNWRGQDLRRFRRK